ncbi:hypothetical protein MNV49_006483 [Pseudohyphozyma bogoriensis]|nr:hypothetical protein MNV49_006483 [Pseudohyphozyma bogoriensis]
MRGIQGTAGEVGEITVLKSKPKSADALALLKKIHHLTKPIMKKHGWYLPTLSEFFPTNPNLLGININGGHKICIRLRPQHAPDSFLDLDQLIGTMLHELTHNVRGPHDQIFYKQLDELQDEFDKLGQTGYLAWTGDGRRVGAGVGHNVGMEQARKLALEKLEQREKMARLLGKGGKLGGIAVDTKGKRRSDIIADNMAQTHTLTTEWKEDYPYEVLHFLPAPDSPPPSSTSPRITILFIPGNPGLVSYYTSFLERILDTLPPSTQAYAVGHLAHSPSATPRKRTPPPEQLQAQVKHKVEWIDGLAKSEDFGLPGSGKNTRLVLVGHSIGAWISLKVLEQRPDLITSVNLLFPTISDMSTAPNGRRLSLLFSPRLHLPLSLSTGFLSYIPTSILKPVIGILSNQTEDESRATTTALVQSPATVVAAVSMAAEEMEKVKELNKDILKEYGARMRWYWAAGDTDGWVSPSSIVEIEDTLDEAGYAKDKRIRCVEQPGLKHAFVLKREGVESLAKKVAAWVKEDCLAK